MPRPHPQPDPAADAQRLNPRDVRRLAVQALYLIDVTRPAGAAPEAAPDAAALHEALDEPMDDGEPAPPDAAKAPAVALALAAWATHADADAMIATLAPDWPTHRQPPVDRAILRLAYFELATRRADHAIVINEAIELAKQFSDERAPPFINGVLDRVAKRFAHPPRDGEQAAPSTGDHWLDDAVRDAAPSDTSP